MGVWSLPTLYSFSNKLYCLRIRISEIVAAQHIEAVIRPPGIQDVYGL